MGSVTLALRPISLLGSIILARLLDPTDFGVIAMAMILLESTWLFASLSMEQAVIQTELPLKKVAFHAFIVSVITGTVVTIFVLANASWLAALLGDPEIAPVLQVLSIMVVVNATASVPMALLRRDLRFGAVAKANIGATVAYLIVSITLALLGYGVWSLVFGTLARSIAGAIVAWALAPGWDWLRPVRWDWSVFRSLMRFGLPATGAGFVRYFAAKVDDWLVGRQLGTEALGYYSKAFDFSNRTVRTFGHNIVAAVFFPAYAKIREEKERLMKAYLKSVQMVSTVMLPIGLGLFATAPLLIPVLLGPKWLPMVTTFQVFSILVLTRPISGNTSSVFNAVGEPESNLKAGLVLSLVLVPMALLLMPYGIAGVAVAVLIGDIAGLTYNLIRVNSIMPGAGKATLKTSIPPLVSAIVMMIVVVLARIYLTAEFGPNIWVLLFVICLGALVYLAGTLLLQREFMMEVFDIVISLLDRRGYLARLRSFGRPAK